MSDASSDRERDEDRPIPLRLSVALVHHPVYDKHHKVVATALTNLDLHDIARSSRTFGVERFFIVHPVAAQRHHSLFLCQIAQIVQRRPLADPLDHHIIRNQ